MADGSQRASLEARQSDQLQAYLAFVAAKKAEAATFGFEPGPVSPVLFPFQADLVRWAIRRGRAALFAKFGLGKSLMQLECGRQVCLHTGGRFLIVAPLGVRGEFVRDAAMLGVDLTFVRRSEEVVAPGLYLTNYESVRDGKLDPHLFDGASLDEADVLRGFGGTKTFREFMATFAGDDRRDRSQRVQTAGLRYRFVATATPSPNAYIELLAYAAFLGVIDIGQAKTRWFKRNSEKADSLTLHPHKEAEFWAWMSTWAIFLAAPSDLSPAYTDARYTLPALTVTWEEIPADHSTAGCEKDGQAKMFADAAVGVSDAARVKRTSLQARVARAVELVVAAQASGPTQVVVWCDLNPEQRALEKAFAEVGLSVSSLDGSMSIEAREEEIARWKNQETFVFLSKPVMYGAGVNLQQAHVMVFVGIGFKAKDIIQAVHRIHRFLQLWACAVHLVYTEAERKVRADLERKWKQHDALVAAMTDLVRRHGLTGGAAAEVGRIALAPRHEVAGERFTLVHNDTVLETMAMADDSVDLIVTSIPFSTQYEYTPSYNDFGHTDTNDHFFAQLAFLTRELLRVLKPGRVAAIHVKDRIVPGGLTGLGFQTVYPFSDDTVAHFTAHGFAFLARKTIVTDVVRENNQTYRLGWTEQCKDGSRMGAGMPEYLLVFRKPPTDASSGYADQPVVKDKKTYTRGRWQFDAHGFMRSSGNRPLRAEDLVGIAHDQMFKRFREYSLSSVYDHAQYVAIAEGVDARNLLPTTFMLLQPQSWHPDVWTDITRMLTLNGAQSAAGRELHLCPLQFDIVDRCIEQYSEPGELVFDPFAGLGTVPMRAVKWKRRGRGHELNARYFADAVAYCRAEEQSVTAPTLFDLDAGLSGRADAE
ncbi:MAG: DNA methyltransferase [Deltaproteobacteria bacterium]|nr:DNA methyltransferase [Myxococcales bacterium]MDP3220946.1 DNA methyltransferase [Deltaproteobacteria bacterium]